MRNLAPDLRRSALCCGVALLLASLLGSCGSSEPKPSSTDVIADGFMDLRMEARKVVTDSVRRDKYLNASQALEDGLLAFDKAANGLIQEYRKAFTTYGTDSATLNNIAAKYRAEYSKASAEFIQAHTAMAASVTADEWKSLAKKEQELLQDIMKSAAGELE